MRDSMGGRPGAGACWRWLGTVLRAGAKVGLALMVWAAAQPSVAQITYVPPYFFQPSPEVYGYVNSLAGLPARDPCCGDAIPYATVDEAVEAGKRFIAALPTFSERGMECTFGETQYFPGTSHPAVIPVYGICRVNGTNLVRATLRVQLPEPPLGCASGAGGFFACPGNSPPSGTPGGPAQNNGNPASRDVTPGAEPAEDWAPLTTVLGGSRMCKPPDAVGDPVLASTGNVYHAEMDYEGPGPRIVRSYNSAVPGWVHNHMIRVIANTSVADVIRPDGRMLTYTATAAGGWASNGTVIERLEKLASGWRFTGADETVEVFDAAGLPVTSTPRHGRTTRYETANGRVHAVIDPWGRRLAIQYDSAGRVGAMTGWDGQRFIYAYDAHGRLGTVTFPDGVTRRYVYESGAHPLHLTGVIDEMGTRFASWQYDALGRAVSASQAEVANRVQLTYGSGQTMVMEALGSQRTIHFAAVEGRPIFAGNTAPCADCKGDAAQRTIDVASGLVTGSADHLGIATLFTWDAARRLPLAQTRAAGRPEEQRRSTQWHPVHRLPVRIDEPGRSTVYAYDERGNRLSESVTDLGTGEVRTTRWTYTPAGLVETVTLPGGAAWHQEYDIAGQLVAIRDPEGGRTAFAYDAAGRVVSRTSPAGRVTNFRHDVRGRVLEAEAAGERITFTYHPTGRLRAMRLPSGVEFTYGYDGAHRLVEVRDSRGAVLKHDLDALGNRLREDLFDANGNLVASRTRAVDQFNRLVVERDAGGHETLMGHDGAGRLTTVTDPMGQATLQAFDALGRPSRTTFADGHAAEQAWNALDQLTRVVDPKGVATQYAPNAFGDVATRSSADMGSIASRFDARGDLAEESDALGRKAVFTRDGLGRPTRIAFADQTQTFTYDADGFVTSVGDGSGATTYTRDAQGRVLTKTQLAEGVSHRVAFTYANGELAAMRYPSGLQVFFTRAGGRIAQVDVQPPGNGGKRGPFVTGLLYTALGQPKAWSWSTGDTALRTFDADGRPASSEIASWTYDAAGRITGVTQQLWTQAAKGAAPFLTPITWAASYDKRNRLTGFTRDGASSAFAYDANGNRTDATEAASSAIDLDGLFPAASGSQTVSQTYSIEAASNRLVGFTQTISGTAGTVTTSSRSQVAYGIDAAGSLTGDGLRTFENDGSGRLAKAVVSRDGEAAAVIYRHNAFSQRVFKSDPLIEDTLPEESQLGKGFVDWLRANFGWLFAKGKPQLTGMGYVYDEAGNLLAETDQGGSTSRKTDYIWLPLDGGGHMLVGLYKDGQLHAVHTDHLGTPRLVTDSRNRPVWQWPYSAFGANRPIGVLESVADGGAIRLRATAPGMEMNLRYPGQYFDAETNLSYNWHRSYMAWLGRYGQVDPIGVAGGLNGYLYVEGNALGYTDPLGLQANRPHWWIDLWRPNVDTQYCTTAECAAGLLPAPSENRTQSQIDQSLCETVCSVVAPDNVVPGGLTLKKVGSWAAGKVGAQTFCKWVCKDNNQCPAKELR